MVVKYKVGDDITYVEVSEFRIDVTNRLFTFYLKHSSNMIKKDVSLSRNIEDIDEMYEDIEYGVTCGIIDITKYT